MKLFRTCLFASMLPLTAAFAGDPSSDATAAARSWVALVDHADYAASWKQASTLLQTAVTAAQWADAAKPVHESLGAVVNRQIIGVDLKTSPPGAPAGEYAIVRFKTKFEKRDGATETVTMFLQDGVWRSAGYLIQ